MLTCIDIIRPATGLGAGASRRTTVEDIIDRTLHLTVIYRLTLIRATERDREMLINIPVTDSCRLIEKHRKGAETQKTVTDFVPPRKTGVQLHLRPTAQEEWQTKRKQKEGQKGRRARQIKFPLKRNWNGHKEQAYGCMCVHLVDGGEASERLPSATWLIL